jgi:uncharacterized LabA/DUF88 family protein
MGPTASASGLLNLLLISILFFRQHKQDRRTQNLIHQVLTKVERVESDVREVQPHLQVIPHIQTQVNNFGKQLPTNEERNALYHSLDRLDRVESTLHNLPTQIQSQLNNVGKQLPTPQEWLNLHTGIASIDTVTSTLDHLHTEVKSTARGLEAKISSLTTSVHSLEEAVNSSPVTPPVDKIAVFVDAANIEIAAKAKGWRFDYQKLERELTKSAPEVLGLFYYTAIEGDYQIKAKGIENYQVISKPVSCYQDGNKKGNLDLEIARDLITKSREFETAILVSGDGDFTCIVEHLQQQQKRVIVVAFGDSTKRELRVKANRFIDLNTLIKVFYPMPMDESNSNFTPRPVNKPAPKPNHKPTPKPIPKPATQPNPIIKPHPRRAA